MARHASSDPAKQKKIKKQIDTIRDQVVEKMESVNLHGVLKDRMVQRVSELAIQIRAAERESSVASGDLAWAEKPGPSLLKKTLPDPQGLSRRQTQDGLSEEALLRD